MGTMDRQLDRSLEMKPGVGKSELMIRRCQLMKYRCYLKSETGYLRGSEYRAEVPGLMFRYSNFQGSRKTRKTLKRRLKMGSPVSSHYAVQLKHIQSCMSIISTKLKRKKAAGKQEKYRSQVKSIQSAGPQVKTKSTNPHNEIHSSCLNYYLLGFDQRIRKYLLKPIILKLWLCHSISNQELQRRSERIYYLQQRTQKHLRDCTQISLHHLIGTSTMVQVAQAK